MVSFLTKQLDHFGQDVRSSEGGFEREGRDFFREVAEMVATAIHLLDRLEKSAAVAQRGGIDWDVDAARPFVPAFNVWLEHASAVLEQVRECRKQGHVVERADEFIHRYNLAKLLGAEFEKTADIVRGRQLAGARRGIPLEEVEDELRRRGGTAGQ